MLRRALRLVCRLVLRTFFQRVEVHGAEHLPADGPAIAGLLAVLTSLACGAAALAFAESTAPLRGVLPRLALRLGGAASLPAPRRAGGVLQGEILAAAERVEPAQRDAPSPSPSAGRRGR